MIYALQRMGDNTHMSMLAQTFKSPDAVTRANTAMVLGIMGDPSAIPLLKSQPSDMDVRVKLAKTVALARLGDTNSQDALLGMSVNRYAEDYYTAIATCPDIRRPEVTNILAGYFKLKDQYTDRHQWTPEERLIVERAVADRRASLGAWGFSRSAGTRSGTW